MRRAIDETNRRRAIQLEYNRENNITPQTIIKPIDMSLVAIAEGDYVTVPLEEEAAEPATLSPQERERLVEELTTKMKEAAQAFRFEEAIRFRDRIKALQAPQPYDGTDTLVTDRRGENQ